MNASICDNHLPCKWSLWVLLSFCLSEPVLAGSDGLIGHRWFWKEVQGHEIEANSAYLEFSESGRISGSSGCNRMMGDYEINKAQISFKGLASTRMFCEGTRGEEERLILKALEETQSWKLDRNALNLLQAGGKPIGRLENRP